MYRPALPPEIDQGCVVANAPFYAIAARREAIVVTPRCDIEHKLDFLTYCALYRLDEFVRGQLAGSWNDGKLLDAVGAFRPTAAKNERNGLRKSVRGDVDRVSQGKYSRYHWLDPFDGGEPRIVDFQLVQSLQAEEASALVLLSALTEPYWEQVASRYAAYMGRVGVPDPDNATRDDQVSGVIEKLLGATEH